MGDNGTAFALQLGMHKDGTDSSQFLTVLAAHNTCLAEQGIDGCITSGQSASVRRRSTRAGSTIAALDGSNVAAFIDQAAAMLEQTLWVADFLHIEHDDMRGLFRVEGLIEVFEHVFDTQLGAITYSPNTVELKTVAHTIFLDEHSGSA